MNVVLEGFKSGHGLIRVRSWNLPEGAEETIKKPSGQHYSSAFLVFCHTALKYYMSVSPSKHRTNSS
jgi:hypothetical protein